MAGRKPDDREPKGTLHGATEGQPPGQGGRPLPSQEALDALAELVQRARHATTSSVRAADPAGRFPASDDEALRITAPVPVIGRFDREDRIRPDRWTRSPGRARRGRSPRWLVRGVTALAIVAVLLGVADLVVFASGHSTTVGTSPPASSTAGLGGASTSSSTSLPAPTVPGSTTTTSSPTSSTTSVPGTTTAPPSTEAAPGRPRLTSVTPARGRAGSVIVLHGRNFFSPSNGVVLARVDGQPAPTACPTQTSCEVTVPKIAGRPHYVAITVTTDSGTSNALTFRYS